MLRDVRDEDLPIFFQHQRVPEANRMAAVRPRSWEAFFLHWRSEVLADASIRKRTIVFQGAVAGNILSWSQADLRIVGYWIGKGYWGRGVATNALSQFLREEPIRPLSAHVAAHNFGSERVLEKCGFSCVGRAQGAADGIELRLFQLGGVAASRGVAEALRHERGARCGGSRV